MSMTVLCFAACQSTSQNIGSADAQYYELVSFDYRGDVIAVWTARGKVIQGESGYQFVAMERRVFNPDVTTRYPFGKPMLVTAANVSINPIPRPLWIDTPPVFESSDR
jgi:hypothetical protein